MGDDSTFPSRRQVLAGTGLTAAGPQPETGSRAYHFDPDGGGFLAIADLRP